MHFIQHEFVLQMAGIAVGVFFVVAGIAFVSIPASLSCVPAWCI